MSYTSQGRKKIGDRRSWRWIRGMDGLHAIFPYIMKRRTDAECYLHKEVDVTKLLEYIDRRNEEHKGPDGSIDPQEKVTLFHTLLYMVTKIVMERPQLNSFIKAKRFYQRDEIILTFVARKRFNDHSEEALMMLRPPEDYTIGDFTSHVVGKVHEARTNEEYGIDGALNFLAKLPRPIRLFVQLFIDLGDIFGLLPHVLTDDDSNHATVLLSNLGSVSCDAVYHHLSNFGTTSIVLTVGVIHKAQKVLPDGQVAIRDVVNLGITVDERIADGFYFARSLKLIDHYAEHPELLEKPLKEDIGYEFK